MKHIAKTAILFALALELLLAPVAGAEPSEVVKGIFDAMLAEGSDYSENKALYAQYMPDMTCEAALTDDGFIITVAGSGYMDGSWAFVQDGDYLSTTVSSEEYYGAMLTTQVVRAVGDYYGMETDVLSGYINGLSALGIENDNFITIPEEDGSTFRINIAGPWDMKELDQMVIDENALVYGPLDGDSRSMAANIGKLMMVANGNVNDVTILLGEYGRLDELAYQSIVNIVNSLQPAGWEDFVASYTGLSDAQADGYSVTLNADEGAVAEIIEDEKTSYSYAIIHFPAGSSAEEEEGYDTEPPVPAQAPSVDELSEGYFNVLSGLESSTVGVSLKTAVAASEVCAFAEAHALYNPDVEPLRANMLDAFEGMSEDDQAAFWQGFDAVRVLLDDCLDDYDAKRPQFENAGVADTMDEVMYDPLNRLAWENLRDHTLTMGNDTNVG